MSILKDIYNEEYFPGDVLKKMPFSMRLKERAFLDAVEKGIGTESLERHLEALSKVEAFKGYANFRAGFRLGVSLMLEML